MSKEILKEILNTYTADKNSVDYKKKFTAFSSVANAESSLVTYTGNIQKDSNTSKYFAKNSVSQITDAIRTFSQMREGILSWL